MQILSLNAPTDMSLDHANATTVKIKPHQRSSANRQKNNTESFTSTSKALSWKTSMYMKWNTVADGETRGRICMLRRTIASLVASFPSQKHEWPISFMQTR